MKQSHSIVRIPWKRLAGIASGLLLTGPILVGAADLPALVYPSFHNSLSRGANPPTTSASSAALFTGTLGAYSLPGSGTVAVVPSGGATRLVESYFGQTFSENIPYLGFETNAIAMAQALLYPPSNVTNPNDIASGAAAFRYKEIQYGRSNGQVRLNYESIDTLFGSAERIRIQQALDLLREALKYAPFNRDLRHALLDTYYDWIVAEQQLAKKLRADTALFRLGLLAVPPNEFIIDQEIANHTKILAQYDAIWTSYSGLLYERAGVDLRRFVPGETLPLGSFIFREEQPFRNQLAASFWDTDGLRKTFSNDGSVSAGPAPTLFAGYKDYVALLSLMRDYVDTAAEAVDLYAKRGRISPGVNDPAAAAALMRQVQTETLVNLACLEGLLPDGRTAASDASGVRAAWEGILTAMSELEGVAGFLRGDKNALGFDPDMLVLFESPPGSAEVQDSYDALMQWINPDATGFTVLGFAQKRFADAVTNYEQYRGYADQVAEQMSDINDSYADRYAEITGYSPDEAVDPWPVPRPAYPPSSPHEQPTHVSNPRPGSELHGAYQQIKQADRQKGELDGLASKLETQEANVNVRLAEAELFDYQIDEAADEYKDKIRSQHEIITAWRSTQAAMQALYDITSDVVALWAAGEWHGDLFAGGWAGGTIVATVGGHNLAIQAAGEAEQGKAERELDLASANFERDVAKAGVNEGQLAAESEIRTLERERISNAVELNDVDFLRRNAVAQVAALQRELARIEQRRSENDSDLAGRYFADPIHFLRAENSVIKADFAFRAAQRWVFFALRALEYKYNQPFQSDDGNRTWDASSLYGLRNYDELQDLLAAMRDYNQRFSPKLTGRQPFTDSISLRQDVWKMSTNGSSDAAFRDRLRDTLNPSRGIYEITLNTLVLSRDLNLRENQGAFFVGPTYDNLGLVATPGRYLDKIDWIKFQVLDRHLASPQQREALFSYAGVSYARTECSGVLNPQAEAPGELVSYPFRYFRPTTGRNWNSQMNQEANVQLTFSAAAGEPTGGENSFWRERSVAASRWTLEVAQDRLNPNNVDDLVIYVRHNAALRQKCQ